MKKRKIVPIVFVSILFLSLLSCASDTPWRKASVTTYELTGTIIEHSKQTAEALKAQNLITDEQLAKIKGIYNKARDVYIAAGNSLKLAGKAESAAKRDQLLAEYDKLLADFKKLAYELADLVNKFKK
jgi:hypothetical protein